MDFKSLPSNYYKNPSLYPNLLDNMEKVQYYKSQHSHQHLYSNKPAPIRKTLNRRTKYDHSNRGIPFYQGPKYRNPKLRYKQPNPHVYQRRASNSQNIIEMKPSTKLVNPSDSSKLLEMNKNVQPGSNVMVKGEVEKLVRAAQSEGLAYSLGNRYFTSLMGEFYCNMKPLRGVDGIMYITSVINGKPLLVDYKTINKALNLPRQHSNLPCIDIYSMFSSNKNEFEIYLAFFCDSDVPPILCDYNCAIHFKHFTPVYQLVALIFRANVLPKPNQDKFFDFFDLKIIFLLVTNKIDFSISYVILLIMINAHLVDYMPYGLLLSSVFDIYHLHMPESIQTLSSSYISVTHVRTQVSLTACEPQEAHVVTIPSVFKEEDVFLAGNECIG